MKKAGKQKVKEVIEFYDSNGLQKTLETFSISDETFHRYERLFDEYFGSDKRLKSESLKKIAEQYTDKELLAIASGSRVAPGQPKIPIVSFDGERIRVGALGDTHLGSLYTNPECIYQAFEEFVKEKVDFITHSGDVFEGMSNRAGHIYELTHLGYTKQKKHGIEVFSQSPTPIYFIDGNHDRWFVKSAGAYIVEDLCNELNQAGKEAIYLGQDEGDISLKGKTTLKLWHGEDGNSYALSYRVQKIVESLAGGEKPGVLFAGHTHKSFNIFERNIQCYSTGCLQRQTKFMRGKRIAAHVGFWIIDIWVGQKGVTKITSTWYPFYA